ncbi:hypothetical protein [Microbacterium suwonense]|nr:hypothetical protein [Microbacterium suwonense]
MDGGARAEAVSTVQRRYCASFVEDASGIRREFVHNPPRETAEE